MTVKEAAERLEISVSLCYALLQSGRLRGGRRGMGRGTWRVGEEAIRDYIRATEWVPPEVPAPLPRVRLKHLDL